MSFKSKCIEKKNKCKTAIYNYLVGSYTKNLYMNFFSNIPNNSSILDIGVGDGHSILEHIDLIKSKNFKIYAVDIDKDEIAKFRKRIQDENLHEYFEVYDVPIDEIEKTTGNKIPFGLDYVFFSNSYSVIPNIKEVVLFIKNYIRPKFYVISTTLGGNKNSVMSFIKPRLSYVTLGVEFGRYIPYDHFIDEIKGYSLNIIHQEITHSNFVPFWGEVNVYTFILQG